MLENVKKQNRRMLQAVDKCFCDAMMHFNVNEKTSKLISLVQLNVWTLTCLLAVCVICCKIMSIYALLISMLFSYSANGRRYTRSCPEPE